MCVCVGGGGGGRESPMSRVELKKNTKVACLFHKKCLCSPSNLRNNHVTLKPSCCVGKAPCRISNLRN